MRCPKCSSTMNSVCSDGNFTVFKCGGCHGLCFPDGVIDVQKALSLAKRIDTGSDSDFDRIRDIQCPLCAAQMVKVMDIEQHHIHYENCSKCTATFLDAGELDDLAEFTLFERVKQRLGFSNSQ